MMMPGMGELLVIFFIVLLIFGTGKLRRVGKDLGGAISEFRSSVKPPEEDAEETSSSSEDNAASTGSQQS